MNGKPQTRIYKNRWFAKFASREGISDTALVAAVEQANSGLIDADLGGGLIKQRVAREGGGKSGGYRTLVFFRHEERAIFAFGFAKSDKANLNAVELRTYKQAAKIVLALTQAQIDTEVREERLFEVTDDAKNL
ncbi:type II toxin-antitoxin system RelE/ParE family toxin [Novosphingobium sp. Chol11]|uniref:type II toxin-antitoxin system RelE/ParE family toxin n=1 Tax=Novosphingobium sp. Chol11 TaxID=1385763 RepID=UPI0025FDF371|nr:type II toxin-antitoxin system RelE/ParE family toxin [Novosphingobium sp. Chol11]